MPTEVQRIPGAFNLPANWPKVQFPRVDEGILLDWWADDLSLGEMTSWTDRKAGLSLNLNTGFDAPVVTNGPNNHKAIQFNARTKLTTRVDNLLPQSTTIAAVYNVDPACSTAARIMSGQTSFRTWTPGAGSAMHLNTARIAGAGTLGSIQSGPIVKGTWQSTAARYVSGKEIYAKTLNGKAVSGPMAEGELEQTTFIVGYNTAATLGSDANDPGFKGLLSRIVMWDRVLTDVDIDAFLAIQKNTFKLP